MDNIENMDSIVCRYFVSQSGCRLGRFCPFPHIVDRNRKPDTICRFFLENKCVFGDYCWHLHKNIPLQNQNSFAEINFENNPSSGLDFNYTENELCTSQKGNFIPYNVHPAVFSEWYWNNNADAFNNFIHSYTCVNNTSFSEAFGLYPDSSDLYSGTSNYYYGNLPTWYHEYEDNGTPQSYFNSSLQHESLLYSSPVNGEITEGQENQEASDFSICTNSSSRPDYYASSCTYAAPPSVIGYESSAENHDVKKLQNHIELKPIDKGIINCSNKEEKNYSFKIRFNPDIPLSDDFQSSNPAWSNSINKKHENIPEMLNMDKNMTKRTKPHIKASFTNKSLNTNGSLWHSFDKEHQEIPDSTQMNENMTECLNNPSEICLLNFQNTNGTWSNTINDEHEGIPETNQTQMNGNNAEFSNNSLEICCVNYFSNVNSPWNHFTNNQYKEVSETAPEQLDRGKNEILNSYSLEVSFSNYFQNINGSADNHTNRVFEKGPMMHFALENENGSGLLNDSFMYPSQHCFQTNYESSFSFSKMQPKFTSTNFNSRNNFQKSRRSKSFQSNTFLRHSNYKQIKKYDMPNRIHRQNKTWQNFAANCNTKHIRAKFYQSNNKHGNQYMFDSRRKWKDLKAFTEGTTLKMSENCNLPRQRPCFSYLQKTENAGLLSQNFSASCFVNEIVFIGEVNNLDPNNMKCLMCLQKIENTYAILENCDHAFCLKCIFWWRGVQNIHKNFANCATSCPVCKKISTCIVPTRCWVASGSEKENVIKRYKNLLKQIHCKYFNRGKGFCVYGNSCIYLHECGKKVTWK